MLTLGMYVIPFVTPVLVYVSGLVRGGRGRVHLSIRLVQSIIACALFVTLTKACSGRGAPHAMLPHAMRCCRHAHGAAPAHACTILPVSRRKAWIALRRAPADVDRSGAAG